MAYDTFLAERIRQRLSTALSIAEKKMMGGLVFMVNDNMCIGVDKDRKTGDNRLMVRVGKTSCEKLLNNIGCREMDFTGKPNEGLFIYLS